MPIYTKKGDKGKTKTFWGEMSKADNLAEALGAVDELNSWIGLITSSVDSKLPVKQLKAIQANLMKINASLAGSKTQGLEIKNYEIRKMEGWIDRMTKELPELKNFIYPVGEIQVARAVCRRAERRVVGYQLTIGDKLDSHIGQYLNRLSDYLFTLARWVNRRLEIKEEVWKVN